ncbi:uncharacterized protein [Rutidosis leptorrhynchoides]|uniref:uncharacterized protein n=1 Tax=Rutidosis leptorrhynchoides TaxID=125765 RepID=UPI003A99D8BD
MDGFDEFIKSILDSHGYKEIESFNEKLKCLRGCIKDWVKLKKDAMKSRASVIKEKVGVIEEKLDVAVAVEDERNERLSLLQELCDITNLEDKDVMQKEPSIIKNAFKEFYRVKFASNNLSTHMPNINAEATLSNTDVEHIQRPILDDEIRTAVWECDLCLSIKSAFESEVLPNGTVSAFVTLIPKTVNPSCIKDYRPISLIGVQYKIISKILANRLALVIENIISKEQTTFIRERQIFDGPMIVSEIVSWYKPKKKKLMLFNVDFEKTYDTVGNSDLNISHLFYADDAIILSDWNKDSLLNTLEVLNDFYLVSGLKINVMKSKLFGFGVNDSQINEFVQELGCSKGTFPFTYFGLPIGVNMSNVANWKVLEDRFRKKLSGWKVNVLSVGGRLILKKLVLGTSHDKGGLDVGNLRPFNYGLLFKWIWRFVSSPNAIWSSIIAALYGVNAGLDGKPICCKGIWYNIVNSFSKVRNKGLLPSNVLRVKVGDGSSIKFWKDNWTGNGPLKEKYGRLCHLDEEEDCLLMDRCNSQGWQWAWIRDIGPRNKAKLLDLINEVDVTRQYIDEKMLLTNTLETRWVKWLPRKINILLWRVALDRLPTRLNLSRRGLEIEDIGFILCDAYMKSSNHLLFECQLAADIWRKVRLWTDVALPSFSNWLDFVVWYDGWRVKEETKLELYVIVAALIWHVWRFRNSVLFPGDVMKKNLLFDSICSFSFSWICSRGKVNVS